MNDLTIDHLSRRASLATLGAAGLAGLLGQAPAASARQSAGKKARKKCKNQVGQCISSVSLLCQDNPGCEQAFLACCPLLSTCDFNAFLTCTAAQDN